MSDFLLHIFSALAEMERKPIVQRINEGLAVAKQHKKLGRPIKHKKKIDKAIALYDEGYTNREINLKTGINIKNLYNHLNKRELQQTD